MTNDARDSQVRTSEGASRASDDSLDLDALEALDKEVTMAPWHVEEFVVHGGPYRIGAVPFKGDRDWIVAARNAFKGLLAAARERDEAAEEIERQATQLDATKDALGEMAKRYGATVEWDEEGLPALTMPPAPGCAIAADGSCSNHGFHNCAAAKMADTLREVKALAQQHVEAGCSEDGRCHLCTEILGVVDA